MVNILGGPDPASGRLYDGYPHALARDPALRVHLYGKDLRPGRKVGHVNAYGDDLDECLARARGAASWLRGATDCRHWGADDRSSAQWGIVRGAGWDWPDKKAAAAGLE